MLPSLSLSLPPTHTHTLVGPPYQLTSSLLVHVSVLIHRAGDRGQSPWPLSVGDHSLSAEQPINKWTASPSPWEKPVREANHGDQEQAEATAAPTRGSWSWRRSRAPSREARSAEAALGRIQA